MTRLVRSEVAKLLTIRSSYALVLMTAVGTAGIGVAVALAPHNHGLQRLIFPARGTPAWYDIVFSALALAEDFALVFGIIIMTGEFRHKTATPTFLAEPRRGRVAAAKLVVSLGAGVVVMAAAVLAAFVLGLSFVAAGYGDIGEMAGRLGHVLPGYLAATVLFASYGIGLGALLKNQVLALVVGLGVTAVVEPILIAAWPNVGRWFPSEAARSLQTTSRLAQSGFGADLGHLLPSWEGALVLVGYALVLSLAGSLTTLRSDIT